MARTLAPRRVSLDFNAIPLRDALAYLSRAGELNIVIDPAVDDTTPITIQAEAMTLQAALKWVLRLSNTHGTYRNQALYVSAEPTAGRVALHAAPIYEHTHRIPDYSHSTSEASPAEKEDDDGIDWGDIFSDP